MWKVVTEDIKSVCGHEQLQPKMNDRNIMFLKMVCSVKNITNMLKVDKPFGWSLVCYRLYSVADEMAVVVICSARMH